ncbi:MAG: V-type ATP synthase subunit F [Limnochordia bacterium]|jgi:V/A-type H+-transporting ATPase subunit F
MSMHKMAVIGDHDSILGFKALGLEVFPVADGEEGAQVLRRIGKRDYAVIFITENVGAEMLPVVQEFADDPLPAILYIPNNQGSTGMGLEKIRRIVERAVGADILSGKEGSQ